MAVKDAVVERLVVLCKERNIKPNTLANISGLTPSTVYSIFDPARKGISVVTLKKLCDGLEISLESFFNAPEFDNLEQEIK